MTTKDIIRKLSSRKLWLAVALFVSGVIVAAGGSGETAETIAGCIMQGGAVIAYILAEGWADASSAKAPVIVDGIDAADLEGIEGAEVSE